MLQPADYATRQHLCVTAALTMYICPQRWQQSTVGAGRTMHGSRFFVTSSHESARATLRASV